MYYLTFTLIFVNSLAFASYAWERDIHAIPSVGESKNAYRAWAGWYWPKAEGGLDSQINDFLSTHQKIEKITDHEIIFKPLSDWERKSKKWWFGYCNYIVEASANYPCEPNAVDFQLKDGSVVHFNREEMKGVLAEFFSTKPSKDLDGFGSRNKNISPGLFHLVIGNIIGMKHDFVGMVYGGESDDEIHNHKIIKYESSHSLHQNNKNVLSVKTKIYYSPELMDSTADNSTTGLVKILELNYTININNKGLIDQKSGKWISEEHTKFLWEIPEYRLENDPNVPIQVKQLIESSTQNCSE